jgi:IS1 family transposase
MSIATFFTYFITASGLKCRKVLSRMTRKQIKRHKKTSLKEANI